MLQIYLNYFEEEICLFSLQIVQFSQRISPVSMVHISYFLFIKNIQNIALFMISLWLIYANNQFLFLYLSFSNIYGILFLPVRLCFKSSYSKSSWSKMYARRVVSKFKIFKNRFFSLCNPHFVGAFMSADNSELRERPGEYCEILVNPNLTAWHFRTAMSLLIALNIT